MEKINIIKLLKDCPSGMELDCTMYDDVYFDYVDELNIIHCYIQHETHKTSITLNQHGTPNSDIKSKCVIFPKGKTSWEEFQIPFKDGDIVSTTYGTWIGIVKKSVNSAYETYITINGESLVYDNPIFCFEKFATEEEKAKLFKAIKDNGYKWNAETKTLEKLTPNKFDINTLVPFESRVLVRVSNIQIWTPAFWGKYLKNDSNYGYLTTNGCYKYCIPYEGNEHLLGTNDDCDEYFKTWK